MAFKHMLAFATISTLIIESCVEQNCQPDQFTNTKTGKCESCSKCGKGWKAVPYCGDGSGKDPGCVRCPSGEFSETFNLDTECLKWRNCKLENRGIRSNGSGRRNVRCGDCLEGYSDSNSSCSLTPTHPPSSTELEPNSANPTSSTESKTSSDNPMPCACTWQWDHWHSLLVVIAAAELIVLCGCAWWYLCRRGFQGQTNQPPPTQTQQSGVKPDGSQTEEEGDNKPISCLSIPFKTAKEKVQQKIEKFRHPNKD